MIIGAIQHQTAEVIAYRPVTQVITRVSTHKEVKR